MNKNFLCKKRIDFDKISIYNMRIFKNKTQNNKNKENSTYVAKELVYPIGRNRGESVAHVKDVISKGGKTIEEG